MSPTKNFQLGQCLVNPLESSIQFDGQDKKTLQPKFIEVLTYLATEYPRLVGREELIEKIWLDNQPVGEKALTNAIWHLRKNLAGANQDDQEVIETIRKVGYRLLIAPSWKGQDEPADSVTAVKQTTGAHQSNIVKPMILVVCFIMLSLIGMWSYFSLAPSQQLVSSFKPLQVTTSPGSELFAAPSPDGHFVVYKWNSPDGESNLYMKDARQPQANPVQLTFDNAHQGHVVFSQDGQHIYFTKENEAETQCFLIKLNVNTLSQQVLKECPVVGGYYYLDLSTDGRTLAFQGYDEEYGRGIYLLDLEDLSAQPKRLSCKNDCALRDRDIAFAPDGRHVAIAQRLNRFNENIYLHNLADETVIALTKEQEDIVGLTWHPNGEVLVYATQKSDVRRGYMLNVNTLQRRSLDITGFSFPAFARQSGELFYQQRREKYHIASLSLNEEVKTAPYPMLQSEFNHHYPSYSAKSDAVAYVSNESGHYELWLTDVAGKNRTQLTHLKQTVRYPRWSHDGAKIAFLAPLKGQIGDKVHVIDIGTRQVSVVKSPFASHNRPSWSLDDKAIISAIYDAQVTDLYQINIADGVTTRLTFDGGRFGIMSQEFGLLYTRIERGLWQAKPQQTGSKLLIDGHFFNSRYGWTLTDKGVFFTHSGDDYQQLMQHELSVGSEGKSRVILRLANHSLKDDGALSYYPQKDRLLFTRADRPQADIKMINPNVSF